MTISHEALFTRINGIAVRLRNAATYVQNDLKRLLDEGSITVTEVIEGSKAQQRMLGEVHAALSEISVECAQYHKEVAQVGFLVKLTYFKTSGKFYASETCFIDQESLIDIWDDIRNRRDHGNLPGLVPGAGPEFDILVEVPGHPQAHPKIIPSQALS